MMRANDVSRPAAAAQGNRGSLVRLLARCGERLQANLDPLVDVAFQRVDDALYDLADKAENDRSYTAYFEALRLVRRERPALKRCLLRNLADRMNLFQDIGNGPDLSADSSRFDSEDLSLVDDEDLEETLVLSNMVSKAETRYRRPLRALTDQFAALVGHPGLQPEQLPVSPRAVGSALGAAVQSVPEMDLATALVIYKVFDKQVMDNLGDTYAACVEFGLALGLKPSVPGYRIVKQTVSSAVRRFPPAARAVGLARPARAPSPASGADAVPPSPPAAGAGIAAGATSTGPETFPTFSFEQLRVLLRGRRASFGDVGSALVLNTSELLSSLSRLQEGTELVGDRPLSPSLVRARLVGDLDVSSSLDAGAALTARRLESRDADTMDLVFLVFEQILAVADIPDALKVLVSRLQIPYVKVALLDGGFFEDPCNPARMLLNRIADISIGWNDDGERGPQSFYGRVRHVVERVVTEFYSDPRLFQTLEAQLAEYQARQREQARDVEARTIEAAGAREAHQRVRRRVSEAIEARLKGRRGDIPPVVATIVYEGWFHVMLKTLDHHGEDSNSWREVQRVLDRLLWSVEPKPDPGARRELLHRIPELLRRLREQLTEVISDQRLIARWLKELQTLHIAALRGPAPAAPAAAHPPPAQAPGGDSAVVSDGVDVDALPVGTWIAIARDDTAGFRAKIAWRSADGESLVLVDHHGRKGFEMSRGDLATLLEQDLAEIIGDGREPLVDRAMAAVRQTLSHR